MFVGRDLEFDFDKQDVLIGFSHAFSLETVDKLVSATVAKSSLTCEFVPFTVVTDYFIVCVFLRDFVYCHSLVNRENTPVIVRIEVSTIVTL